MKPDLYTKVILTSIAIFLGVIAFEYRPVKDAWANGHSVMSIAVDSGMIYLATTNTVGRCPVDFSGTSKMNILTPTLKCTWAKRPGSRL